MQTTEPARQHQGTVATIDQRVKECIELLVDGETVRYVVEHARRQWGITRTQAVRYVKASGERLKLAHNIQRDFQVARAIKVYGSVINDPKARPYDKVRAQAQIDLLFGLAAPVKHEMVAQISVKDELDKVDFAGLVAMARQLSQGQPAGEVIELTALPPIPPEEPGKPL